MPRVRPTPRSVTSPAVPRWAAPATIATAGVGLVTSGYLLIERMTTTVGLACPQNSVLDCVRVTQSPQSSLFGMPLPVLGLGFFAAMIVLGLPQAWRSCEPWVRRARLGFAGAGVVMVLYLVFVELFVVDAICLWCTVVHAASVALLGFVAVATAETAT